MLRFFGAVLLLASLAGATVAAETDQARFGVTAIVPQRVAVETVRQPDRLVISEADVQRGYVDVAARYVVSHSTERGWMLSFAPRVGITERVEIHGLADVLELQDESLDVYRPRSAGREELALEYRFVLDPRARPGTYELPVLMSATPL